MRTPRLTACLLVAISTLGTLASAQEKRPAGEAASTRAGQGRVGGGRGCFRSRE